MVGVRKKEEDNFIFSYTKGEKYFVITFTVMSEIHSMTSLMDSNV